MHFGSELRGRIQCDVCPRYCKLHEGQRGLCFVRARQGDQMVLTTYGRSSGFCIDPIEKKPLNHFLPGTPVLSFGTAGCNLACKFCQNWDISKARESRSHSGLGLARGHCRGGGAQRLPVRRLHLQRSGDLSRIRDRRGAGLPRARHQDGGGDRRLHLARAAASSSFGTWTPRTSTSKALPRSFTRISARASSRPVLETLEYLKHETDVWFEITTLLIPGENDSAGRNRSRVRRVMDHLGPDVPLHFTAFHPDWKMTDSPPTPPQTLRMAQRIAKKAGLRYVYTGNVHDPAGQSTHCHGCGAVLIGRDWYDITAWNLSADGRCPACGTRCHGVFEAKAGSWGPRRQPVRLHAFDLARSVVE